VKIKEEILGLAVSQAKKSPMGYLHGAVIFKSNKIIGAGYNWPVAPPGGDSRRFSIHAERDALKGIRADQAYGASLLSVRVTKNGSLASSKPCKGCMNLLTRKGLESVFWFDSHGNLNRTYL